MKNVGLQILLLAFFSVEVWSQESNVLAELRIFENEKEEELITRYQSDYFLLLQALEPRDNLHSPSWAKLNKKLFRQSKQLSKTDSLRFLEDVFFMTQQNLFVTYEEHANFSKTLHDGIFDCVTGSGIFALLLEKFGFDFKVMETDAHVYIKGMVSGQPFIMESTFPLNGFLVGDEQVRKFESNFIPAGADLQDKLQYLGKMDDSPIQNKTFNEIGLRELGGLQYYNDAIKKFYEEDYLGAYSQLLKAEFLYPSSRINKFKVQLLALLH